MHAAIHRPVTHMPSLLLAVIASVVAALLAALALTGGNDHAAKSPNYNQTASTSTSQPDLYRSSSVSTEVGGIAATNPPNNQPLWQSDVMDSHESIASLAALPKAGKHAAKVSANPSLYPAIASATFVPLAPD